MKTTTYHNKFSHDGPEEVSCGCLIDVGPFGIRRCVGKCHDHVYRLHEILSDREKYYRPVTENKGNHVAEFEDGMLPMEAAIGDGLCIEVGCGVSPYTEMVTRAGFHYLGIDSDRYAFTTMHEMGFPIELGPVDDISRFPQCEAIIAAHVLEHLKDAPAAFANWCSRLLPGGILYLIVPNDRDLANPDHWWFFNEHSLLRMATANGLSVERMERRSIVSHEDFLYLKGRKTD
jgi:2-polyprenyl-3-methyl-5-hydroxy-6-metoxy-1,4-benzoquinol methylase